MKKAWLAGGGIALLAFLAGVESYLLAPRRTPAGQAPLRDLVPESLQPLRGDFNASAGAPRIVVLLSPT